MGTVEIATAATGVLAAAGLGIAIWQIISSRASSREATAVGLYNGFLHLGLQHPEVANPKLSGGYAGIKANPTLKTKFHLYLTSVLLSCEAILKVTGSESHWRASVLRVLSRYGDYFAERRIEAFQAYYDEALLEILREIIAASPQRTNNLGAGC